MKKKVFKLILQLLVLVLVGGYISINLVQSTFASNSYKNPNVIITINKDGFITQEGSLFGDKFLYPATVEEAESGIGGISGVIRLNNQYKGIRVTNLGIGLDKDKLQVGNDYPIDTVYNSFLDDIKLKIEKGMLFLFDNTLVDYISLRELLYQPENGNYRGYMLDDKNRFTLNKGDTVDLKYTLHMVPEAGNELEDVTAVMPIYINVHEYPIVDDVGDDDTEYKDHDKSKPAKPLQSVAPASSESHWSHDCIITLLNHRIIHGYTSDTVTLEDYFNGTIDPVTYVNEVVLPERYITRAETAVLVGRALGLKEQYAESTEYLDYIPNWARGYVISTTEANIFMGYPTGVFKPNNYITREEMIAVLTRAFNISLENESLELPFKDKDDIGSWAVKYVKAGYESEVIVGYPNNTYRPKNPITRAETFTIICKLLGLHEHVQ